MALVTAERARYIYSLLSHSTVYTDIHIDHRQRASEHYTETHSRVAARTCLSHSPTHTRRDRGTYYSRPMCIGLDTIGIARRHDVTPMQLSLRRDCAAHVPHVHATSVRSH